MEIFDVYDELGKPTMKIIGIYLVLVFVFLNVLVLLNFVIAMMADTYAMMTSVRKGLYNYSIINSAPSFKPEKQYGGLILTPPFCLLSFLVLPFYIMIEDKKKLETLNKGIYLIYYTALSIPMSVVFMALNLLLMPLAYIKTCIQKVTLVRNRIISCPSFLAYLLVGPFVLLIAQLTDLIAFLRVSFSRSKIFTSAEIQCISQSDFELFFQIVKQV